MYLLCLNIKISAVTCPGVWLCPKGEVVLKIRALNQNKKTKRTYPRFPLNFVEKLSFQRLIIGGVETISSIIEDEELQIELIQWTRFDSKLGVILAKFSQRLHNIFDSFVIDHERISVSSKTELLMCRTEYFPGIISPKINATFELEIESYKTMGRYSSVIPDNSCQTFLPRQRRVCHSQSDNPHCALCSLYDVFDKYPKSKACKCTCNCYCAANQIKTSFCSWCNFAEPVACKCCYCCKYHCLFH